MKKILLSVSLLCLLSIASAAQQYQQHKPQQLCVVATYNCNGIQLDRIPLDNDADASYSFGGGSAEIVVGGYFSLTVNGTTENGSITHIDRQPPPLRKGISGPFGFHFALPNGQKGGVVGKITTTQVCGRYCFPVAIVESSSVRIP
jgi:opacity protein-like surface antigen